MSKPIAATPGRRRAAVANVPDCRARSGVARTAPSERGKNSYHAENSARCRSTQIDVASVCGEQVTHRVRHSRSSRASAGARRSISGARLSPSVRAADVTAATSPAGTSAAARSSIAAPSARSLARSSAPWPAAIFFVTASRQVRYGIGERFDGERPLADRVGNDAGDPSVFQVAAGSHAHAGLGGTARIGPHDVAAERLMTFAVDESGNRHDLADDGFGGVTAAGDRRGYVLNGNPKGHRPNVSPIDDLITSRVRSVPIFRSVSWVDNGYRVDLGELWRLGQP